MGVFDLTAPLLSWIDTTLLGFLPAGLRIILWSAVAAALVMAVYALVSPQERLARLAREARKARAAVTAYDGEFDGLAPLALRSLRLSLAHLGAAFGPALLAGLPFLFILVWMSNVFGHRLPEPGAQLAVEVTPEAAALSARNATLEPSGPGRFMLAWPPPDQSLALLDGAGHTLAELPFEDPVTVLHKHQWWNVLIANPAGYLPEDAGVDSLTFAMPRQQYLDFGPAWMRGWEFAFLAPMTIFSLIIKFAFRIR
jgi:hypothetical protein